MANIIERDMKISFGIGKYGQLKNSAELKVVIVKDKDYVIGRAKHHALIVLKDDKLSRAHVRLYKKMNSVWIEDLATKNGTYLNNEELDKPRQLKEGDIIKLGSHLLQVKTIDKILDQNDITSMLKFQKNEHHTGVGKIVSGYGNEIAS